MHTIEFGHGGQQDATRVVGKSGNFRAVSSIYLFVLTYDNQIIVSNSRNEVLETQYIVFIRVCSESKSYDL